MALHKVVLSVRQQMHRVLFVSSRCYSSETDANPSKIESKDQYQEDELNDIDFSKADMNDVYITGTVVGEPFPLPQGNGVTFLLDSFHFGRYGNYKVRTKVVAVGVSLPAEGAQALRNGQRLFIKGRLGSKTDRSTDEGPVTRSSHLVGRSIKLL